MTNQRYIRLGKLTAFVSFLLGTIIFGLYYLTSDSGLLFLGYGYIILIGLINIGVLIVILIKAKNAKDNRKRLLRTCGLMLINIPVMLLYCWIAIILLGTMRISFTNETGAEIRDINVIGCGGGNIEKMENGESKTIWIDITGDCAISIDYLLDGHRKAETVASYVTNSMGQKIKHNIDGRDKDIF